MLYCLVGNVHIQVVKLAEKEILHRGWFLMAYRELFRGAFLFTQIGTYVEVVILSRRKICGYIVFIGVHMDTPNLLRELELSVDHVPQIMLLLFWEM